MLSAIELDALALEIVFSYGDLQRILLYVGDRYCNQKLGTMFTPRILTWKLGLRVRGVQSLAHTVLAQLQRLWCNTDLVLAYPIYILIACSFCYTARRRAQLVLNL